jgi:hypothetical protein
MIGLLSQSTHRASRRPTTSPCDNGLFGNDRVSGDVRANGSLISLITRHINSEVDIGANVGGTVFDFLIANWLQ